MIKVYRLSIEEAPGGDDVKALANGLTAHALPHNEKESDGRPK